MKKDPSLLFDTFKDLLESKKITPASHSQVEGFDKILFSQPTSNQKTNLIFDDFSELSLGKRDPSDKPNLTKDPV